MSIINQSVHAKLAILANFVEHTLKLATRALMVELALVKMESILALVLPRIMERAVNIHQIVIVAITIFSNARHGASKASVT